MNLLLSYPALDGETVTEAHAAICVERGHATHTEDGVASPICPRCGEFKQDEAEIKQFNEILDQEFATNFARASHVNGVHEQMLSDRRAVEGRSVREREYRAAQGKLFGMVNRLSREAAVRYGEWRATQQVPNQR